jgi:hypothetical protein
MPHSGTTPSASRRLAQQLLAAACVAVLPTLAAASCGADFCSVNSNWTADSVALEPGSSFDLRYEYIKQDQPRAGDDKVAVGQIHRHHDEVSTRNRNLLATYNHNFDSAWGVSVTAPIVDRDHFHIHNHHGVPIDERWNFTELGDVRVVGRYQLPYLGDPLQPSVVGLNFGLKLPTGKTTIANDDGDVAERSLQPGTGTTDAIVGAYYQQKLPAQGAAWFAQAQYQRALYAHDDFKPGDQLRLDLGYRHGLTDRLSGLIQLNLLAKGRNHGAEAEPEDSGGRYAAVSPGLSYAISDSTQIYAFVQLPIAQYVNGVQLTADKSIVVGWSGRF